MKLSFPTRQGYKWFLYGWGGLFLCMVILFYMFATVAITVAPAVSTDKGKLTIYQNEQLQNIELSQPYVFSYSLSFENQNNFVQPDDIANPRYYKLSIQKLEIANQSGYKFISLALNSQTNIQNLIQIVQQINLVKLTVLNTDKQATVFRQSALSERLILTLMLALIALLINIVFILLIKIFKSLIAEPNIAINSVKDKILHQHTYRPDIDGLRALAVGMIIVYHINNSLIPGGFIGVDIFFVISGFLITGVIYRDIQSSTYSYKLFYARRMRRILPLMYTVLLCVFLAGLCLYTTDDELVKLAEAIKTNVLYFYNFYLLNHGNEYFDVSSEQQPLLHMWSLAVEEQFYFVLPITLLILHKISSQRKFTLGVFSVLAIMSVVFSIYSVNNGLSRIAYYMLPSRVYELLLGAMLVISLGYIKPPHLNKKHQRFYNKHIASLISFFGLGLIAISSMVLNAEDKFPGILGLLPTIGACAFILGGWLNNKNLVARVFSSPIMVGTGIISYALYLWHWPILAFYRYETATDKISFSAASMLLVVIILVAYISYKYIEKPIRSVDLIYKNIFIRYQFIPALVLLLISIVISAVILNGGTIIRFMMSEQKMNENSFPLGFCHGALNGSCIFGDLHDQKTRVALYGDSHAGALGAFFDQLGKKNNFSLFMHSNGGCVPLLPTSGALMKPNINQSCIQEMNLLKNDLTRFDTIILAADWAGYISMKDISGYSFINEFQYTLVSLLKQNKRVIVVGDVPTYTPGSVELIHRREHLHDFFRFIPLANMKLEPNNVQQNSDIRELVGRYHNIYFFDIQDNISNKIVTYPYLNNYLLYNDSDHLNPYGSLLLEQFFANQNTYRDLVNAIMK